MKLIARDTRGALKYFKIRFIYNYETFFIAPHIN